MQYPRCQHDNPAGQKFCGECGARLTGGCPSCGSPNPPGQKFCGGCGASLTPAAVTHFSSPESYTPKHLAEKILTSKSALEGERKQVTVLFCDMANSTGLAVRLGPETMHGLLSSFFEMALVEVHRYEGTINQFLGDGFMALFGAPVAHEDHARRAVLAALGIQRAIQEDSSRFGQPDGAPLVRIGLNTGLVVVGTVGDNLRMDYTAVGDTTNLAARLQQHAEPGTILVSETTGRLVRGYVRVGAVGPIQVKGRPEPILAFRVVGLGPRRSPLDSLEDRALSRFVGRQRELAALRDAFDQVEAGQGQVVGIVAEPGAGKSRLLYEFRQSLADRRVTYLEGRCLSYGSAIPYVPVLDLVRQNCGIGEGDTPAVVTEKARVALSEVGMALDEWLPFLLQFLGIKEGTERLAMLGPETTKARTFEALRLLSLHGSRRQPLILAVEDPHWIDKTSEEYFTSLVESLADAPILLLTTYRPGYRPPWIEKSYASQITLRPLSEGDSLSLVRSVVQRVPLTDAVARVILSRAEGNPFFLEELTRVVEHGELGRGFEVPDTVQGVLMARIDRLPEETRRVLQTASVLGREFSLGLLALFLAGTAGLDAHLRELKRLEFLYERTGRAEPVYVFKHALTQEVAYESLLTSTRKALHARAGQALETLYSERLEEHYEVLAYHYGRSPDTDKAFEYLERANQKTAKANAVEGAKTYFDAAMTLLDTLPETEANQRRRITLLLNQLLVFRLLSKLPEYHALLVRHEPMAVRAGDPGQSGVFYARLGYCEYAFGRLDDAILTTSKAARLCETAGNADGAEQAYVIGQWSHASKGSYDEALVLHADVLRTMEQRFQLRWHMWTWCAVSWSYTWLGCWERAEEAGQNALRAGQEFSDDSVASYAAWTTSCAYTSKGDMARAIEHGQLAVQRAVTPFDKSWAPVPLAWAWCRAGDPRRGVAMLAHALPATRAARFAQYTAWHLLWLGEGYELAAEHDRAREVLEELLDLDKDWGMRFIRGSAHRILGEIALATNPSQSGPPFAVPHFERSIALLGEIKAENELALAYAGVGRLRKQRGAIAEAHEFLSRALEIFERLGTLIEPDRVRAELAELTR